MTMTTLATWPSFSLSARHSSSSRSRPVSRLRKCWWKCWLSCSSYFAVNDGVAWGLFRGILFLYLHVATFESQYRFVFVVRSFVCCSILNSKMFACLIFVCFLFFSFFFAFIRFVVFQIIYCSVVLCSRILIFLFILNRQWAAATVRITVAFNCAKIDKR